MTFGCLNNFAKISPQALELWSLLLQRLPQSRLLLNAPAGSSRAAIVDLYGAKGIAADRLLFVDKQPLPDYLRTWQRVDIALDPFPYGGGITTCDALWMGVPVITLSGRTSVGRGARSILGNLGLPELVANSPEDYLRIATELAGDVARLKELRTGLRERMARSPLRDARGFARDLESSLPPNVASLVPGVARPGSWRCRVIPARLRVNMNLQTRFGLKVDWLKPSKPSAKAFASILIFRKSHNDLGVTLQALGRNDEAAEAYREALRLVPDHLRSAEQSWCLSATCWPAR